MVDKKKRKIRRKTRIRSKIQGTKGRPRLSVFRSNKYIYAQAIDDEKGETLLSVTEAKLEKSSGIKTERARNLGRLLAKLAVKLKIKRIVFDRGSYRYHGRIKAFAEGLREGGLEF